MNKIWISTISAAGTLGTAGAAFAGVNVVEHFSDSTPSATTVAAASTSSVERTIQYQIGTAGTVTIKVENGELKVYDVVAADGWSVVGASTPGAHVEVQFTDGTQIVTFGADWVDPDVTVTLTTAPVTPDTSIVDTTVPGSFDVTIISDHLDDDQGENEDGDDHPHPGTPGTGVPTTSVPPASTTAPSAGGDDDEHESEDHDDDHDDEHEVEDDD